MSVMSPAFWSQVAPPPGSDDDGAADPASSDASQDQSDPAQDQSQDDPTQDEKQDDPPQVQNQDGPTQDENQDDPTQDDNQDDPSQDQSNPAQDQSDPGQDPSDPGQDPSDPSQDQYNSVLDQSDPPQDQGEAVQGQSDPPTLDDNPQCIPEEPESPQDVTDDNPQCIPGQPDDSQQAPVQPPVVAAEKTPEQQHQQEDADFQKLMASREGHPKDNKVYLDNLKKPKPTVGIGHLVVPSDGLKVGDTVSDEQVTAFFKKDGAEAMSHARSQAAAAGIKDSDFMAYLASVNFQLGTGWTDKFPKTWKLIVDGKYEEAAQEAAKSDWAKQTPTRLKDFQDALRRLPQKPE